MIPKQGAPVVDSWIQSATLLTRTALVGQLFFVAIVVIEHLLNPSLDPLGHEVSEYVNTGDGALMVVGFLGWAISLAATALLAARFGERIPAALFALAALGMVLVASFPTQTEAGELPPGRTLTSTGHLHDIGSALTALSLLGTAIWGFSSAGRRPSLSVAAAICLLGALVISVALLVVGPSVGGLRQRLVLLIGCAWQLAFLRSIPRQPTGRPRAGMLRAGSARGRGSC